MPEDGTPMLDAARGSMMASHPADATNTDGEGATAEQTRGAHTLAASSGGAALPSHAQEKLDGVIPGIETRGLQVHENVRAVRDVDAGAAAVGRQIFLADRLDVDSPAGLGLLAEEVVHTAQSTGATGEAVTLGGTNNAAEAEAGRIRDQVEAGEVATHRPQVRHNAQTIQRGEAGVHMNDITMPALGVDEHRYRSPTEDSGDLTEEERRALQVYSGNFLSDFSQANVPSLIGAFENIRSTDPRSGGSIGAEGAGELVQSIIHALAILELGTDAASVVTAQNTEVYEPERHLDNPMGTDSSAYSVTDSAGLASLIAQSPTAGAGASPRAYQAPGDTAVARATNEEHSGSAVPGLQYENPTLYEVSPAGLSNFLYNSVEASKHSYLRAAQLASAGDEQTARMHVGYGDHPIQDYYSHTNFIEVALNRYINGALSGQAIGREENAEARTAFAEDVAADGAYRDADEANGVSAQYVATYYNAQVERPDGEKRDAITSGTFGAEDTKVSIAHTFLPVLPKFHASLMAGIDTFMALVEAAPPGEEVPTLLDRLQSASREGAAFTTLLTTMGDLGVAISVPTDLSLETHEVMAGPWEVTVPNGELEVGWTDICGMDAVQSFLDVYGTFKDLKERVKSVTDRLVPDLLQRAWDRLVYQFTVKLKQSLTHLVALMVASITNDLTGEEMSLEDYADVASADLDALMEQAHHALHDAEETTSLSHRLADGDLRGLARGGEETRAALERQVGPVTLTPDGVWHPEQPLPPSHSEISKDHAPHDPSDHDHGDGEAHRHPGGGMGEDDHGSVFFGISNALGREAMRHIYTEIEAVFREAGGEDFMGWEAEQERLADLDEHNLHEDLLDQAFDRAGQEGGRASGQGHAHMQTDGTAGQQLLETPSLSSVFDLVDLFVSHPDDGSWWHNVVDSYVAANREEVHTHIRRRNSQNAAKRNQ